MRIARIRHLFYPDLPRDYFYELSARQVQSGHQVDVFTWKRNNKCSTEKSTEGFAIHRLPGLNFSFGPIHEYPYLPSLPSELAYLKPDIIHAESHLFLPSLQAIRKASKLNLPCVVTVHGIYAKRGFPIDSAQFGYIRTIGSEIFKKADKVICLTQTEAKELVDFRCPLEKINIVPNAVDTELFKPFVSRTDNLVVWSGRFVSEKGLEYLLEAAEITLTKIKSVHFLLIGYGPLKAKILRLINERKLCNVHVVGPLTRQEIANILGKAAVFAFPSLREGLPVSVLEAMSCGLPVVGFNISGVKDIVTHNGTGFLVPPKDSKQLSEAIITLISDNQLRKRMGDASRKKVMRLYSWERVIQLIDKTYEQAISVAA
jgi:glycosyltransferase involved in cell wall biosynthesis